MYTNKLLSTTIPPVILLAPLASPSPTDSPSIPVLAYTPIHPTQSLGIGPMPETYSTFAALGTPAPYRSGTGPTLWIYMQPSKPASAAYTPPGIGPTFAVYMQPLCIGSTIAAYMQPASIRHTSAS